MHSLLRRNATSIEIRHEIASKSLQDIVHNIEQDKIEDRSHALARMAHDHSILALHAWQVHRNAAHFRQHMYLSSQLNLACLESNPAISFKPQENIVYALFSDHDETIQRYVNLRTGQLSFDAQLLRLALNDDYITLDRLLGNSVLNPPGTNWAPDAPFPQRAFYGHLTRANKQSLETDIITHAEHILVNAERKSRHSEEVLIPVCALKAKLCLMKGIPIEIDHPLVPPALTRITPLAHYEMPYAFLHKRHWPQGIMHKLVHWLPGRRAGSQR